MGGTAAREGARPAAAGAAPGSARGLEIIDLTGPDRERALPPLKESFVGIYRWHAKRTLRDAERVRAAVEGGEVLGAAVLTRLAPEAAYVYYIFVGASHRRQGIAGRLLDDAIAIFRQQGAQVVWAAAEEDNAASIALFSSRGFGLVGRDEPPLKEGGLGAWGFRSQMMLVHGEVLLGRRL